MAFLSSGIRSTMFFVCLVYTMQESLMLLLRHVAVICNILPCSFASIRLRRQRTGERHKNELEATKNTMVFRIISLSSIKKSFHSHFEMYILKRFIKLLWPSLELDRRNLS